jgi:protein O-mannosyl-transferase
MPNRKKLSPNHAFIRSDISTLAPLSVFLVGAALIVTAVLIVYLPSLNGGFIWDDEILVSNNRLVRDSDGLYRIWFSTKAIDYWPLTNTTFWIEWHLWGMNTTGYHFTNIILHIVDSLLIWIILRRIAVPGAFLAALIFAVHPVNVESVAWIAQRKNTLAMLFFLLSILWYLKNEIPSVQKHLHTIPYSLSPVSLSVWYWLSLLSFLLAMLSKGSVAVLPILLLGIVWWLRPLTKRDFVRTAPFFAVAVGLAYVNVWFQTHGSETVIRSATFLERLLGAGTVVWFYLYTALLPIDRKSVV